MNWGGVSIWIFVNFKKTPKSQTSKELEKHNHYLHIFVLSKKLLCSFQYDPYLTKKRKNVIYIYI